MIDKYQKIMNQERADADVNTEQLLFQLIRPRFKNLASKGLCKRKIQVVSCYLYYKKDAKKKKTQCTIKLIKGKKLLTFDYAMKC